VRAAAPTGRLRAYLRLSRPKQWTKNLLVVAAPAAADALFERDVLWRTVVAVVAFCLASSGTYWINDALDVEADRRHPRKRHRPVAAGLVPVPAAVAGGSALIAAGIAAGFATGWPWTAGVIAAYAALTLTYSLWCKHLAVVDLVLVAFGFVLRAIGGAVAVAVPVSNWFLLCTSFGSLLIVTGKRFGELLEVDEAGSTRATLLRYDQAFLRMVMAVAAGSCLLTYCLWAFERAAAPGVDHHLFELSILPMATALLRYLLVIETGAGSAPEEVFLADRTLQVLGVLWLGLFGAAVALG
jgi:decaprenyl-phosphate phosphoribosyltransferase